jgi:hypothetical protein
MKLCVKFRYGPPSDSEYMEVPDWEEVWRELLPNIEKIRIYTLHELKKAGRAADKQESQSEVVDSGVGNSSAK